MFFDENNVRVTSNVNPANLDNAIEILKNENPDNKSEKGLKWLGESFLKAEKEHNINAILLAAIACMESGFGTNDESKYWNNIFTLKDKGAVKKYKDKASCIDDAAKRISEQYLKLDPNHAWRYVGDGKTDIRSIGKVYCKSDPDWSKKVIDLAKRIVKKLKQNTGTNSPSTPVGDTYYRVISGSFKDKQNALNTKDKLYKDGFTDTFLAEFVKDEETYYRVVVGSFKDKKLAEQRNLDLKAKGYDGFITEFEK